MPKVKYQLRPKRRRDPPGPDIFAGLHAWVAAAEQRIRQRPVATWVDRVEAEGWQAEQTHGPVFASYAHWALEERLLHVHDTRYAKLALLRD